MKQYKVVDNRNKFRNDPACTIMHDNETAFVVNKEETDTNGNSVKRVMILNPKRFQEERIVDEKEAVVLTLKGVRVINVDDNDQTGGSI